MNGEHRLLFKHKVKRTLAAILHLVTETAIYCPGLLQALQKDFFS